MSFLFVQDLIMITIQNNFFSSKYLILGYTALSWQGSTQRKMVRITLISIGTANMICSQSKNALQIFFLRLGSPYGPPVYHKKVFAPAKLRWGYIGRVKHAQVFSTIYVISIK